MEIKLKKVHTPTDLIISAIVLAAGIGLYFVNKGLGAAFAFCGLLMLILYRSGFQREGDHTVLQKASLDVAVSCRESLKEFLDGKDVDPVVDTSAKSGVILLEVYYNSKASLAYAQLFDFSNYTYEPATGIVEIRGKRAQTLISKL